MRIVAMSDSHQNRNMVNTAVEQQKDADLFIHLGDGLEEFWSVMQKMPHKEVWSVRGNCDSSSLDESLGVAWVKDYKVLYTHGHEWGVKIGLDDLKKLARKEGAKIVLFGHTHTPYYEYEDGIYYLNPGSLGKPNSCIYPTYATIDIQSKNIVCNHIQIKNFKNCQ